MTQARNVIGLEGINMKDFATAALPWILIGPALAILAVNHGMERQQDEKRGAWIATGAALGLLLGVVLNGCGLWEDHLLGFAIGPLWGMALAALFTRDTAPKDGNESGQS